MVFAPSSVSHRPPRSRLLPLTLAVSLSALAACGPDEDPSRDLAALTGRAGETAPAGPRGPAAGIPVEVAAAVTEPLEDTVVTTGELLASEEVRLRSEASGRVTGIFFEEGSRVASGRRLVKINDAELKAELERAKLQRDLAVTRNKRAEKLYAGGVLSEEGSDEAANRLSVLQAEVELIQARIAETEVRAPFSGVIGLREVSVGSYLTPGTPIAGLQRLDPVKIDFSVPEKYAPRLAAGDRIEFTVAGVQGSFQGDVYAVEPRIDPETRTVPVRARAANPDGLLVPGAFAKVRWILGRKNDALMVPSRALVPGLEETRVYVVEDGKAQPRAVETGVRTDTRVEILAGLEAGEQVIVGGLQLVQAGAAVSVAGGTPPAQASRAP